MDKVVELLYNLSNQVGAYDLNQWELSVERLERQRIHARAQQHTKDRPNPTSAQSATRPPTIKSEVPESRNSRLASDACSCEPPIPDIDTDSPLSSALPTPTHHPHFKFQNPDFTKCDANLSEFIDVDLIKGSTFSKAKTTISGWNLLLAALKFYFLLPMFPEFWRQQISSSFYQMLLVLYVGQLSCWYYYLYSFNDTERDHLNSSHYELLIPLLFGINLSIIHCRVVSTKIPTGSIETPLMADTSEINGSTINSQDDSSDDEASDTEKLHVPRVEHKRRTYRVPTAVANARGRADCSKDTVRRRSSSKNSAIFEDGSSAISYSSSSDTDTDDRPRIISDDGRESNREFPVRSTSSGVEMRYSFSATSVLDPLHTVHKSTPSYTAKNAKIGCRCWQEIREDSSNSSSGYGSVHVPKYSCHKLELTAYDIASRMTQTVSDRYSNYFPTSNWALFIICYATLLSILPTTFRYLHQEASLTQNTYKTIIFQANGMAFRFLIAVVYFSMLCVALKAYYQRLLFAKLFSRITSARRAQKHRLPHFRLSKTKNIKVWLTLRSYLKRRGPQRSIDVIVSSCFLFTITLLCIICVSLLQERENNPNFEGFDYSFKNSLGLWEITGWCAGISIFLLKFIIIGSEINKRYLSTSVLLTEQLNLFFRMDQKPEQKEELTRANQVLQVAQRLLNEIDSPYKLGGMVMSPLLYQLLRVVVLSAFSGVVSEFLGFKLKLWKIKA